MMQVGSDVGMQTMADAMDRLVESETVAEDEARSRLSSVTAGDAPEAGGVGDSRPGDPAAEAAKGSGKPRIVRANPDEYSF